LETEFFKNTKFKNSFIHKMKVAIKFASDAFPDTYSVEGDAPYGEGPLLKKGQAPSEPMATPKDFMDEAFKNENYLKDYYLDKV